MADEIDERFARTLHHAAEALRPNEPLAPPIAATSVYRLPVDPAAPYQYGRWSTRPRARLKKRSPFWKTRRS